MLVLGHIGITLSAGLIINQLIRYKPHNTGDKTSSLPNNKHTTDLMHNIRSTPKLDIFDIIFLTVGSLLPDIIDKPIGHYLFSQTFGGNGRIFSHTLLFTFIILGIGLYFFYFRKRTWLLALSFGVFMHLILDYMWLTPVTLFWPFFGWHFPFSNDSNWLGNILHGLLHNPDTFIPEFIGLFIIIGFILILVYTKQVDIPRHHITKL